MFERLHRWQAFLFVLAALVLAGPALAQTIGSPNTVTADPPVARPATTPCIVQLYTNFQFADFSPKPFSYAPPAACPGPWAKVVLEADFAVTTGRQFDRTAQIAVGHVNIYYGTTQEPSRTVAPTWHVERDLTDYGALFRSAQTGEVNLGNLVDSTFTGILSGSARLLFYPASPAAPAPRAADVVLSLSDAPGGAALLATTANILGPTLSLPRNIEGAYLDLITQSQSSDEFWYTCVPDDVADQLFSCSGTSFREAQVTVDGQPAGIAPVYPWLFTGAIDPLLWRPIPSVQTLNFVPYRVDLTPFAGLLSNGQPHRVAVNVFNANNYFLVAGSLLLYLDTGSVQVTGAVTRNTLTAVPTPAITENLVNGADGSITGTVSVGSQRAFKLEGYVNTSHGRIETSIEQEVRFTNDQRFVLSDTRFEQDIVQRTEIATETETGTGHGNSRVRTETQLSYPLDLSIVQVLNADGSVSQTTTSNQKFLADLERHGHGPSFDSQVSNAMATSDTLIFGTDGSVVSRPGRTSSQTYFADSKDAACYSRTVTATDGLLTAVTDGCGHGHGH